MSSHDSKDTKPTTRSAAKRKSSSKKKKPTKKTKPSPTVAEEKFVKQKQNDDGGGGGGGGGMSKLDEVLWPYKFALAHAQAQEASDTEAQDYAHRYTPGIVFEISVSRRAITNAKWVSSDEDLRNSMETFILENTPDDEREALKLYDLSIDELFSFIREWDGAYLPTLFGFTGKIEFVRGSYLDTEATYAVVACNLNKNTHGIQTIDTTVSVPVHCSIHRTKEDAERMAFHEIKGSSMFDWDGIKFKDDDEQCFEPLFISGRSMKKTVGYSKAAELMDKYQPAINTCVVRVVEVNRS